MAMHMGWPAGAARNRSGRRLRRVADATSVSRTIRLTACLRGGRRKGRRGTRPAPYSGGDWRHPGQGGRVVSGGVAASSAVVISPEFASAALSCVALSRARRLAAWVGAGRTLTSSGVLRPAEAAQACRDLGIELAGPRLRSALDVGELMRDWVTAAAAGFLEIDGRRAWAAPDLPDAGSSAHTEPEVILNAWLRAATAVLDLGEEPCAGCLTALHELHAASGPLTMEQLASAVGAVLEPAEPAGVPCPGCGQFHRPGDLLGLADLLGDEVEDEDEEDMAGHVADTATGLLAFGAADASDGAVRL